MAVKHDPNNGQGDLFWPHYTTQWPALYTLSELKRSITNDTYRGRAIKYLMDLSFAHPL